MSATPATEPNTAAVGLTVFAAIMLMMIGAFQAIQGLVALFNDTFYVVGEEYIFTFDLTTWGWIHLILGTVVAVAGFFLLQGQVWARTVAVIVAGQLRLVAVLPGVEHRDHHPERVRDLGADRPRPGRHPRLSPRYGERPGRSAQRRSSAHYRPVCTGRPTIHITAEPRPPVSADQRHDVPSPPRPSQRIWLKWSHELRSWVTVPVPPTDRRGQRVRRAVITCRAISPRGSPWPSDDVAAESVPLLLVP
jgi:hypothetical protein